MYRTRDLCLRKVFNSKGKLLGIVEDIYIDLKEKKVLGLKIIEKKMFSKNNFININKIIIEGDKIIATDFEEKEGIIFKSLKGIEVYDYNKNLKGVVEDLFIDEKFNIIGVVISRGIIDNFITGKEILLLAQCEYKDNSIFYKGKEKILFKTMIHECRGNYEI